MAKPARKNTATTTAVRKNNKANAAKRKNAKTLSRAQKAEAMLNKVIYTADQEELDFYDIEDDATPSVGDFARINGEDAEGEHTLANGDIYHFEGGELMEIDELEAEELTEDELVELVEEQAEVIELLETEKAELESELEISNKKVNRLTREVKNLKEPESKGAGRSNTVAGRSGAKNKNAGLLSGVNSIAEKRKELLANRKK